MTMGSGKYSHQGKTKVCSNVPNEHLLVHPHLIHPKLYVIHSCCEVFKVVQMFLVGGGDGGCVSSCGSVGASSSLV